MRLSDRYRNMINRTCTRSNPNTTALPCQRPHQSAGPASAAHRISTQARGLPHADCMHATRWLEAPGSPRPEAPSLFFSPARSPASCKPSAGKPVVSIRRARAHCTSAELQEAQAQRVFWADETCSLAFACMLVRPYDLWLSQRSLHALTLSILGDIYALCGQVLRGACCLSRFSGDET